MRTDYLAHDGWYRRYQAEGKPGWDDAADYEVTQEILQTVLSREFVPRRGRLLELGCGAGNITLWLGARGYEVHGVDISPVAIGWARQRAGLSKRKADFREGNVVTLHGWPRDKFDVVLDGHCLHCIIGSDRARTLRSAFRVLKPGGCLIVHTMVGPHVPKAVKGYDRRSRCQIVDGVAVRYFGRPDEILAELGAAGFRVEYSELMGPRCKNDNECMLVGALKPKMAQH